MQTLRKKNSPCKFKNEPTRFLGEGVSFKAKLIGILEVSEARGDRMCQAALADLKMAIRAAGEHKQRIAVQVSIDGLRLRDEKSGDCLYHHPVHKISFIAQDMSDSRAFGYIFGSPDTGHRFFGIKTDKAASQVVIAMRDLFQVVFELKKKEIELTKQHLEQNAMNVIKFHTTGIFVEPTPDTKGAAGSESSLHRVRNTNSEVDKSVDKRNEPQSGVIRDLLDIQFELDSLQQGIHHMNKITPDNPPPSADDLFETDPFGDSFANMKLEDTVRPILPPPPSSSKRGHLERQQTVPGPQSSITSSPATTLTSKTPPLQGNIQWFEKEAENLFSDSDLTGSAKNTPVKKDSEETQAKSPQIDVFTELDPLGTGLIKPYVDKKDFFQHLKNPPKKVLKDLVSTSSADTFPTNFNVLSEPLESAKPRNDIAPKENQFEDTNFANFDRFDENEAIQSVFTRSDSSRRSTHHQPLSVSLPPEDSPTSKSSAISIPTSAGVSMLSRMDKDSTESMHGLVKLPSPIKSTRKKEFDIDVTGGKVSSMDKPFPVDFSAASDSPASPLKSCPSDANSRLSSSSAELELVPEPPPRGVANILINPPPLPPKKQGVRGVAKPPPRPPHTDTYFHYDFPEREPVATTKDRSMSPLRDGRSQSDDSFSSPVQLSGKSDLISAMATSAFEDSFSSMIPSAFFTDTSSTPIGPKKTKPSLDITLSQLTSTNLDELANSLGMTVKELTSLTLQQLTECLATLSAKEAAANDNEEPVFTKQEKAGVAQSQSHVSSMAQSKAFEQQQPFAKMNVEQETKQEATYDKYAVFRELLELEQMEKNDENAAKDTMEEETFSVTKEELETAETQQQQETIEEPRSESLATLVNLTVKLPPSNEDLTKEEQTETKFEETTEPPSSLTFEKIQPTEAESKTELVAEAEALTDLLTKQGEEDSEKTKAAADVEEKRTEEEPEVAAEKLSEINDDSDKPEAKETSTEETNGSLIEVNKAEVKSSVSTSSDKYAALREIIGEPEPPVKQPEDDTPNSTRMSPVIQLPTQQKTSAEVELLNLFSDTPPPSSPKKQAKKEEDSSSMGMDIFEEIKMLSNSGHAAKTKSLIPEDIFSPFTELKPERDESKDDSNWTKFDTGLFVSDRPLSECPPPISRTSPWSPDGKEFHREASFKGSVYQQSGDSDNEWKDEEESEESNGRIRDGRFRCSHYPRFDVPFGSERGFYEETSGSGNKRDWGFRDRTMEKSRDAAWIKNSGHRPRDSSPWHDESQWEKESKHYPHRKMQYKDEEEHYELHRKCRSKPQRWNWPHEHGPFYDDERRRKMMLWKEDRFGSQESMGYDDDDRWSRRKYERRRWEEDARFWNRRPTGPPDSDYPSRESYYYYRERPHDYPSAWNEDYGSDRPTDDSPRYNQSARKRHWPKRPNSANEGRNVDMVYPESRGKFGTSRSECNDNDSDPYLRSSQRSRSRQSYWGSDQEYDSWVDRPYWSEEPDTKSENLHRKRIPRHKLRQAHPAKTQSPFEDDFAQSVEHADPSAAESLTTAEPRVRSEASSEQKPSPQSPSSFATRYAKAPGRRGAMPVEEVYSSKRSSYFEDDLSFTATGISDSSDRQRLPSDQKATPEELPCDSKNAHQTTDDFVSGDSSRDSFFNGHLRYDDDAFAFKPEMEDNVPDHRATTLPLKNHARQGKYSAGSNNNNNNNNNKSRNDQHIRKSESVNIFVRENDPFGDDDFFD
ncbi:protein disabled isoform X1 [Frieseomelitta varia]|uniref:protein disabled isoform X1 n=2 Tax=Frieseomelitta varia TaxID=561572 RepID=UPI001CB6AD67|nr:protein disabled isoform X1 [Frieseomelitta varia]